MTFERRFRTPKSVFERTYSTILGKGICKKRKDGITKIGISSSQRICAAIRILAYGTAEDGLDEYIKISESTCLLSLRAFWEVVLNAFRGRYSRQPTESDLLRIMATNA